MGVDLSGVNGVGTGGTGSNFAVSNSLLTAARAKQPGITKARIQQMVASNPALANPSAWASQGSAAPATAAPAATAPTVAPTATAAPATAAPAGNFYTVSNALLDAARASQPGITKAQVRTDVAANPSLANPSGWASGAASGSAAPTTPSVPISNYPFPNAQVAPLNNLQQLAMGEGESAALGTPIPGQGAANASGTPAASTGMPGVINPASQNFANLESGTYLNPAQNPYLQQTYQDAANQMTTAYQDATAPSLEALANEAGGFGGSAMGQNLGVAQGQLNYGLSDLANQVYGGNYNNVMNEMTSALPQTTQMGLAQSLPSSELMNLGSLSQEQLQNELNTQYQNQTAQAEYPFELGSYLGGALGTAGGGTGTATGTTTNPNYQSTGQSLAGLGMTGVSTGLLASLSGA
ncbi:MAG: hypothetical protein ACREQ4_01140, partial [Candidatus Binataceae bacterium]